MNSLGCSIPKSLFGGFGAFSHLLQLLASVRVLLILSEVLSPLLLRLFKLCFLLLIELDFTGQRSQVLPVDQFCQDLTEVLHIARVGPLSQQHKVVFGEEWYWLSWLSIWYYRNRLEA